MRTGRILFGDISPNFDLKTGMVQKFRPNSESVLGYAQRLFLVRNLAKMQNQFWGCEQRWVGIINTLGNHQVSSWASQSDLLRVSLIVIP